MDVDEVSLREALCFSVVRSLLSTLGLAEMAILQWILFAEAIGVPPSMIRDARALATSIETFVRTHQVGAVN